jgi:hypothetical protein
MLYNEYKLQIRKKMTYSERVNFIFYKNTKVVEVIEKKIMDERNICPSNMHI